MEAVVEFHGFKDNYNRFIIKELAVVATNVKCQFVFRPPFSRRALNDSTQRTVRWLERHYHGIQWNENGIPYSDRFICELLGPFVTVYTKGMEKAKYLRRYHPYVQQIPDNIVAEYNITHVQCTLDKHRRSDCRCALKSAVAYYNAMHNPRK